MRGRKRSRSTTGTRETSKAGASVPARTSGGRQGLHPLNKHAKWESLVDRLRLIFLQTTRVTLLKRPSAREGPRILGARPPALYLLQVITDNLLT
ncbi:TPA: hypothetical protein ACH3X1_003845 [Trebouxia sp. C0004]